MNKVICDICGTMYPENASQCPICGCAKSAESTAAPVEGVEPETAAGEYTFTKGGRFSKANVRKRNKAAESEPKVVAEKKEENDDAEVEEKSGESNKGLIIAIVMLIISIIGMLCYIFFTYFAGDIFGGATEPVSTTTVPTITTQLEIKCEDLDLQVPGNEITMGQVGQTWQLNVVAAPADTTDEITFATSDPEVAVVSPNGQITAVGAGSATITVTCGDVVKQCLVTCNIETEPATEETTVATEEATEPATEAETEPTTEPTTQPEEDLTKFTVYPRTDCTIDIDETFTLLLRDGNGNKVDVTWTATVEGYFAIDGNKITGLKATPVDPNEADKIRATCTYQGVEFSCIIRVRGKAPAATEQPTEPEDGTEPTIEDPGYTISHTDVTISVGESFRLILKDSNGEPVEVTWVAGKPSVVSVNGNTITGMSGGTTIVSYKVGNYVYECIVRVNGSDSNESVG